MLRSRAKCGVSIARGNPRAVMGHAWLVPPFETGVEFTPRYSRGTLLRVRYV
jgi:hypothetical protein